MEARKSTWSEEEKDKSSKMMAQQARSVMVEGLPSRTTKNDIIIHFQRTRNNGGDVEDVTLSGEGKAMVVFESPVVAENVLLRNHTINGASVKVKSPLTVFTKVTATVVSEDFCHNENEMEQLLMNIKKKTNIDFHFASYGILLSGTLEQIAASRKLLQTKQRRRQNYDSFENVNGCVEQSDEEGYETDKTFMEMFNITYQKQLDDIKGKYSVDIVQYSDKDGKMKVNLKTTVKTKESLISQARSDFISLYQKAHQNSLLVRISACHEEEKRKLRKVVQSVTKTIPVVVDICEDRVSFQLYGDKTIVHEALEKIGSQVKIATDGPEVHGVRSRQGQQSAHFDAEEPMELEDDSKNLSVCYGSVKISVIKGDITDERVDAIVNAANEYLSHGSGVAGAIVTKGGYEIQDESKRLVRRRGPLKVGDVAVTKSGRLPCKHIIHAVGPMWDVHEKDRSKELLWKACINSLREAECLECQSIALPAISSGIFGMPKEISAQVLFTAVEDYVQHQTALKDVRFVIIDDPTFDVFRDEFEFYYSNFNNSLPNEKSARNSKENEQRVKKERRRSQELYSVPKAKQHEHENESGKETSPSEERYSVPTAKQDEHENVSGKETRRSEERYSVRNVKQPGDENLSGIPAQSKAFVHEKVSENPLDDHSKGGSGKMLYSGAVKGTSSSAATAGNPTREKKVSNDNKQFENRNKECPVCFENFELPKTLDKCGHRFCEDCTDQTFRETKNSCPIFNQSYGLTLGNQPDGEMTCWEESYLSLPGYENYGRIVIDYYFPGGIQGPEHPNPGQRYSWTTRRAFLPACKEGWDVLHLLRKAFDARLLFTVGRSANSGLDNQIIWNGIHHKTSTYGGPYSYPDSTYLSRVKAELAAKGIY